MVRGGAPSLTDGERQKIIELYTTKVDGSWPTCTAVAREVGRSRGAVEQVIDQAGLTRRGRRRRVTAAERGRIVALYQTKKKNRWVSTLQIAGMVGRPASTVHRVPVEAGVDVRPVGEALRTQVPDELRTRIIHLYTRSGWSYPRVATYLGVSRDLAYMVLDEADVMVRSKQAKIRAGEGDLLVALYRQGRSSLEVADLISRSAMVVRRLARKAGVLRSSHDGASLANTRRATRTRLARLDLRPYARRWMDGTETEELAAELSVPADLLWDALAAVLAVMTPDYRTDCAADRCLFGCVAVCAASAEIGTTEAGRLC
jgi:transposase-like protein